MSSMPFSSPEIIANLLAFVRDVSLFACSVVQLLLTRIIPLCALFLLQIGKSLFFFAYSAVSSSSSSSFSSSPKGNPQPHRTHSVDQIDEDEDDTFQDSSWMDAPLSFFQDDYSQYQLKDSDPIDDSVYFDCYSSSQLEAEPYIQDRQAAPSLQPVRGPGRAEAPPPYPAITRDSARYPSISTESEDTPSPPSHSQYPHQSSPYPLDSVRHPHVSEEREAAPYPTSPQDRHRSSPSGPQQDGLHPHHTLTAAEQERSGRVKSEASAAAADLGIHDVKPDAAHDDNAHRVVPPTFSEVENFVKEHASRKLPPSFSEVERTLRELSWKRDGEKHAP